MPVLLFMTALTMVSCDGLLNVNSDQYTYDEQYRMKSEHDSLYAFVGIMSKLQLLGDRYVLLGELRGDLMETGSNASRYLKEINEFNITKDNPYAKTSQYYDIINNCNYVIQYVDTSARVNPSDRYSYNLRVIAMAKAVRAWTYLQLVLNYGDAKYIVNPILSEGDVVKNYPTVNLSELCDLLIDDLLPFYQSERIGSYNIGQFADFNSKYGLINIRFLLGDLYLWKGSVLEGEGSAASAKTYYKNAALMYYNLMSQENLLISRNNASSWTFTGEMPTSIQPNDDNWSSVYTMGLTETITALASSADYGKQFSLDSLSFNRMIAPTKNSIANWDNQVYFYTKSITTDGDLRERGSVSTDFRNSDNVSAHFDEPIITKFLRTSNSKQKVIILYRNSLLYLRYAEAVNRLGCSNLAFATLKYGLNREINNNADIQNEITNKMGSIPSYMNFSSSGFNRTVTNSSVLLNVGVHARGCGLNYSQLNTVAVDTVFYRIPYGVVDSAAVSFVEDKIVDELALETAYEGNRFHDLMRVALRRGDPAYLADRVSVKYANKETMRTKLMNPTTWYLPK